jgi:ABC-type Zn uptake system ZnuABC Zn-binding protein ZnuA
MKRILLILAALALATPAFATVKVVTSVQDFASIADAIGGKRVETFALAKGYQDPHFVDPKPSFVLKLSKADLLIVAGPAPPAISTPRTAATSSSGRPARSPARWGTSTHSGTRTSGSIPRTAGSSRAPSRRS